MHRTLMNKHFKYSFHQHKNYNMRFPIILFALAACGCLACQFEATPPPARVIPNNTLLDTVLIETTEETKAPAPKSPPSSAPSQKSIYYRLEGKVGDFPVTMHLVQRTVYYGGEPEPLRQVSGYYFYERYQHPITVSYLHNPEHPTDRIIVHEHHQGSEDSPRWDGKITSAPDGRVTYTGRWYDATREHEMNFSLIGTYASGSLSLEAHEILSRRAVDPDLPDGPVATIALQMLSPTQEIEAGPATQLHWDTYFYIAGEVAAAEAESAREALASARGDFFRDIQNQIQKIDANQISTTVFQSVDRGIGVVWNRANRLCLAFFSEMYTGGAHANYGTSFVNYDLRTGRILMLTDVFENLEQNKVKLSAALEQAARKQYRIPDGTSLDTIFFENSLVPGDNFVLTGKGIWFNYPPYVIGPFSMGEIRLFIPFAEVADIVKPGIMH